MERNFKISAQVASENPLQDYSLRDPDALEFFLSRALPYCRGDILELGARSGNLAEKILLAAAKENSSTYTGTETSPHWVKIALPKLRKFGSRAKIEPSQAGSLIAPEDQSMDFVLSYCLLEQMQKDHMYMAFSEARRTVKEGGHWAIFSHAPGKKISEKLPSALWKKIGTPMIELDHYISPEDWEITADESYRKLGLISRFLLLRRIP